MGTLHGFSAVAELLTITVIAVNWVERYRSEVSRFCSSDTCVEQFISFQRLNLNNGVLAVVSLYFSLVVRVYFCSLLDFVVSCHRRTLLAWFSIIDLLLVASYVLGVMLTAMAFCIDYVV